MRTTVTLDSDVAAAVASLRQSEEIGLSEAVNRLVRRGLVEAAPRERYVMQTVNLGLKMNVDNIAEVLEYLDELEEQDGK